MSYLCESILQPTYKMQEVWLGTSHFLVLPQGCGLTNAQESSDLHQDVVDGDVNELHKVADEPHDGKPHCCCQGDLLELCRDIRNCSGKAHTHTHSLVCNEICNSLQKHRLYGSSGVSRLLSRTKILPRFFPIQRLSPSTHQAALRDVLYHSTVRQ